MLKLASLSSLLAVSLVLTSSLTAQIRRLPGLPVVSPPAGAPGLAAQPLFGNETSARPLRGVKITTPSRKSVKPDPATSGVKKKGKALKAAIKKVKALPWNKRLKDAQTKSRQSGKPILMLQTLGEIGGLA
ncbi:MAG: hypothetical protein ACJA0V_004357 [Planctomycetota bacterium]|jgi:hypothetical protein